MVDNDGHNPHEYKLFEVLNNFKYKNESQEQKA